MLSVVLLYNKGSLSIILCYFLCTLCCQCCTNVYNSRLISMDLQLLLFANVQLEGKKPYKQHRHLYYLLQYLPMYNPKEGTTSQLKNGQKYRKVLEGKNSFFRIFSKIPNGNNNIQDGSCGDLPFHCISRNFQRIEEPAICSPNIIHPQIFQMFFVCLFVCFASCRFATEYSKLQHTFKLL